MRPDQHDYTTVTDANSQKTLAGLEAAGCKCVSAHWLFFSGPVKARYTFETPWGRLLTVAVVAN